TAEDAAVQELIFEPGEGLAAEPHFLRMLDFHGAVPSVKGGTGSGLFPRSPGISVGFVHEPMRSLSSSSRRRMKSWALVITPNAWWVPRSLSLLTTNSVWSTQMVVISSI